MVKPDLEYEQHLWQANLARVVGLDEVGRGALCAGVVAAAVVLGPEVRGLEDVRDSKLLSARQRERLVPLIQAQAQAVGIGAASPAEIKRLNLRRASALAMERALRRIGSYDWLLVDGLPIPELDLAHQTAVIKGDTKVLSIACASVIAKVCRDRLVTRLAGRYPGYGWERNAGYATQEHRAALQTLGLTPHHRHYALKVVSNSIHDTKG